MLDRRKQIKKRVELCFALLKDFLEISKIEQQLNLSRTHYQQYLCFVKYKYFYIWKLIYNNQIIGFIYLQGDKSESEILSLGIKKDFQRLGFGKFLICFLIKKGFKNIFLEVSKRNISAIKFYQSQGFKKISIRKKYYKTNNNQRVDAFVMNLTIF